MHPCHRDDLIDLVLARGQVTLDVDDGPVRLHRVHGVDETHDNAFVPGLCVDEGVELAAACAGEQNAVVQLYRGIRIRHVVRVFRLLIGIPVGAGVPDGGNRVKIHVLHGLFTRRGIEHHVQRLDELNVGHGKADVRVVAQPVFKI